MCGIVGYIGMRQAVPILLEGLSRLEYRGYDSAGIATVDNGKIKVTKTKGRLDNLINIVGMGQDFCGNIGIGHTRWATHGKPSDINSHPHLSESGKFAVVHNGIIENYIEIKNILISKGYKFISETDTEVIAHLIDHYYEDDILDAMIKVIDAVTGSYALGIVCTEHPDKLLVARKDSPLVLGVGKDENFVASDIPAILKHTKDVYLLENDEIALISSTDVKIFNTNKEIITKKLHHTNIKPTDAEKGEYEHFMMKEIEEQPTVFQNTINSLTQNNNITLNINITGEYLNNINKVYIIACGSAYHAGIIGKYVIEELARVSVEVDFASEFRYRNPVINNKTLVIAISQSGETADTLAALRKAKEYGAKILSIVNVLGSSIALESDYLLHTLAGPEIAVATTKAYSAQLAVLYIFAIYLAEQLNRISERDRIDMLEDLRTIPAKMQHILSAKNRIYELAMEYSDRKNMFFLGRNLDYGVCLEASLKLKEISYVHSEGCAAGEFKHGLISLIEEGTLVIVSVICDKLVKKMVSNMKEVEARGAKIIAITNTENTEISNNANATIHVPKSHHLFAASLGIVPLQLFGYYSALIRKCDIDKPRNLAKSVTVE